MPDRPAQQRPDPLPEERPSLTPDRNVEAGVRDSFPASDAPATTAAQGVRAVPVEAMVAAPLAAPPADAVRMTRRFPSQEAAKLAMESLVRDAPIDRRCASIEADGAAARLVLVLPPAERDRVEAMLDRLTRGPGLE